MAVCAYFGVWWRGRDEAFRRGGGLLSSGGRVSPCGGSTPGATSIGWPLVPAPYSLILPLRAGCLCARTLHSNGLDGLSLTIYLTRLPGGRSPSLLGAGGLIPPWVTQTVRHRRRLEHTHATRPHTRHVHALTTARAPHSRAQTSSGGHRPTSPPLPLRPAPLLVGRRRGGCALADAAHRRQHAAHAHVPYTCTR